MIMNRIDGVILGIVIGIVIAIIMLVVIGFQKMDENDAKRAQADYIIAPKVHTCTEEQTTKVHTETLFCKENTNFFSTYCYGTAIMRNCTKNSTLEN